MRKITAEELDQLKQVELEILLEVKRVCEELDIQFFIESGTLLGAVRHGGFIPWDDDIDIGMIRGDYERFLAEAQAHLRDGYFVDAPSANPHSHVPFAKVRKRNTLLLEHVAVGLGGCQGIWIDILPWDVVDGDEVTLKTTRKKWLVRRKLYGLRSVSKAASYAPLVKKVARKLVHWMACALPASYYKRALESVAKAPRDEDSASITCLYYFSKLPNIRLADALPLVTVEFEGCEMPAFRCWEDYLIQVYGDWRTPLSEPKRRGHDVVDISFDCGDEG